MLQRGTAMGSRLELPETAMTGDLRTRIAAVLRTYMFENSTAEELADAVIAELEAIPFTDQTDRSGAGPLLPGFVALVAEHCPEYLDEKWVNE